MNKPSNPISPTWAEVSLGALRKNFKTLQKLARGSEVLPVVKANAYGHGLVPVSKSLIKAGAKFLVVAFLQEGVKLRKAGVKVPVLILTPTLPAEIPLLLKNKLIPQVSSEGDAREISQAAGKLHIPSVAVHVKIDTGMARVGIQVSRVLQEIEAIRRVPGIRIAGVYTHLATADWTDPQFA